MQEIEEPRDSYHRRYPAHLQLVRAEPSRWQYRYADLRPPATYHLHRQDDDDGE